MWGYRDLGQAKQSKQVMMRREHASFGLMRDH
jgi:hypothetical protein